MESGVRQWRPPGGGGDFCWFDADLCELRGADCGTFPAADGARPALRRGPLHEAHHPRGAVAQRIRSKGVTGGAIVGLAPLRAISRLPVSLGDRHDAEGAV